MLRRGGANCLGGEEAPEPLVTTNDTNLRRSFLTWYLMPVNFTDLRRDLKSDSRQSWGSFLATINLTSCRPKLAERRSDQLVDEHHRRPIPAHPTGLVHR